MKNIFLSMLALSLMIMSSAPVSAAENDELWEVSTKMEMPGMPFAMPAQTSQICIQKGHENDPNNSVPKDKNQDCKMSDVKISGNKSSWKMKCEGKHPMTGEGEMTRGDGSYSGKTTMHSKDGDMMMAYTGKRVGTCDAAAEKQKMDDKVNAMMGDFCDGQVDASVRSGGYEPRMPEQFTRKDQCAASKPAMCEKARSFAAGYEGYPVYAQSHGWVAAECGINLEKNRANLCQQALADDNYDFAKQFCPAEAKVLESKHNSAGRSYTATGRSYTASVPRTANSGSSTGNPAASVLEGAKKLKGLFGF